MSESVRRERQLGWITGDGQRFPLERAEDWSDAVEKGICPFCGSGPFVVVASHVSKQHNVRTRELRDLIGATYSESICDPTFSASVSERSRKTWKEGSALPSDRDRSKDKKPSLSKVARERAADRMRALSGNLTSEQRRAWVLGTTPMRRQEIRTAAIVARDRRNARIVELLETSTMTHQEIAGHVGCSTRTIQDIARRFRTPASDAGARLARRTAAMRASKTLCANGHPLNDENTHVHSTRGTLVCRVCGRISARKSYVAHPRGKSA